MSSNQAKIEPADGARQSELGLLTIWVEGTRLERVLIAIAITCFVAALITFVLAFTGVVGSYGYWLAGGLIVILGAIGSNVEEYHRSAVQGRKLAAIKSRSGETPQKAWDLARVSLEGYIDQNRSQVRWIFRLVLFIMVVGFAFVSFGVWLVYQSPGSVTPAIVAASSGIISQFIGATFLLIFRSTIAQAREYVFILERINAVGMSINILESMAEAKRDGARSELIRGLLSMHGTPRASGHTAGERRAQTPNRRSTKGGSQENQIDDQ